MLKAITNRVRDLAGNPSGRALLLMVALLSVAVVYLLSATPPWESSYAERKAEGRLLRAVDYARFYSWWAALLNAFVLGAIVAGWRWLSRAPRRPFGAAWAPAGRGWWLVLAGAVMLGAGWRVPRLSHSLWNDEEYALRRYSWGEYEKGEQGELVFEPAPWVTTVFYNRHSNNHIWHSLEARASLAVSRAFSPGRADGMEDFSEAAARAVPFACGLMAIGLVGVLGRVLGAPYCGLAAAFLLALSPWHIRYSVEARGYSTMMFAVLVIVVCLLRALESGKWRWWLGFGAGQALAMLSFLGSVYFLAAVNLAAMLFLWFDRKRGGAGRWVVANLLGAVLVTQLVLPSVPQVLGYLKADGEHTGAGITWAWLHDLWSHLVAGIPPTEIQDVPNHGIGTGQLAWGGLLLWGAGSLTATGLVAMLVSGWRTALVALAFTGGAMMAIGHTAITGAPVYTWYLAFTLPGLAIAWAWLGRLVRPWGKAPTIAVLAVIVCLYAAATWVPRDRIARFDRQPIAAVVAATRGEAHAFGDPDDPAGRPLITATFGVSDRQMLSYDPRVVVLETVEELEELEREAAATGGRLVVPFCGGIRSQRRDPALHREVTESGRYRRTGYARGMESYFSYEIWELIEDAPGEG